LCSFSDAAPSDNEIVVEDPDAPEDNSPAVTSNRTVEIVVYVLLLALAAILGYDNYKSGMGWASTARRAATCRSTSA
jgi:hypothetical protein